MVSVANAQRLNEMLPGKLVLGQSVQPMVQDYIRLLECVERAIASGSLAELDLLLNNDGASNANE